MIVGASLGPVPVTGRLTGGGPLLFVIRGVGGVQQQFNWLLENLPDDVALVNLPGVYSRRFARNDIHDFAAGFDEVLARLDRRAVVVGVSMGGVAAMALRYARISRLVLIDTPLTTEDLWPLDGLFQTDDPAALAWLHDVMGYSPSGWTNRDYRGLLAALPAPATVLLASEPLFPRRPIARPPSLVRPEDRALYGAAPGVKAIDVEGTGHHLAVQAPGVVLACLRWALREAAQTTSPAEAALSQ